MYLYFPLLSSLTFSNSVQNLIFSSYSSSTFHFCYVPPSTPVFNPYIISLPNNFPSCLCVYPHSSLLITVICSFLPKRSLPPAPLLFLHPYTTFLHPPIIIANLFVTPPPLLPSFLFLDFFFLCNAFLSHIHVLPPSLSLSYLINLYNTLLTFYILSPFVPPHFLSRYHPLHPHNCSLHPTLIVKSWGPTFLSLWASPL